MKQDTTRDLFRSMLSGNEAAAGEISGYLKRRGAQAESGDTAARNELEQLVYDVSYDIVAQRMRRSFPFLIGRRSVADVLHAGWERLLEKSPEPLDDLTAYCRRILSMVRFAFLDIVSAERDFDGFHQAPTVAYTQGPDDSALNLEAIEASGSFNPVSLAVWSEFHEQIRALPEDVRDVFELYYYLELPRNQIATQLGITEHRVRVLVLDACQRLGRACPDLS